MELVHLQTFLAVADAESITQAANRLSCVQSNVTARINRLEQELQASLFMRSQRGVSLTAFGQDFYPKARKIIDLVQQLKCPDVANEVRGNLRVGAVETVAALGMPAIIADLSRLHPLLTIELKTGTSQELIRALKNFKIDAAIVSGTVDDAALSSAVLREDELVLVRSAYFMSAPVSRKTPPESLFVFRQGCAFRAALEAWLYAIKAVPQAVNEIGSLDGIMAHVAAGRGVTALPRRTVQAHSLQDKLHMSPLPSRYGKIKTSLVRLPDNDHDAKTHALLQAVRATFS
ncbi:LysR family transcriptional regulator [Herbaspirillum sp. RV1423]|uniref:LysR family transcriptional regulator n=1 Tax=Herbaspirillum sp. RV1423 TaxID=1443993 RepID=UPI000685699E|nr:LysR family transcriptional regulator [Herbaspirillum sp. RV1423]